MPSAQTVRYDVCPQGCPYQSIQRAIDASPDGTLVLIGPGAYRETVQITKNISLWGAGLDKTLIQPLALDKEAFLLGVSGGRPLKVNISRLSIQAGQGILLRGFINVSIEDVQIAPTKELKFLGFGIQATGTTELTLINTTIRGATIAISIEESGQLYVSHSNLDKNNIGISLSPSTNAVIADTTISVGQLDGANGLSGIGGGSQVLVTHSQIIGVGRSLVGVSVVEGSEYHITDSTIFGHSRGGIEISRSGRLTLLRSIVTNNGIRDEKGNNVGGAVLLIPPFGKLKVIIENSKLKNNLGWGIADFKKECFVELSNPPQSDVREIVGAGNQIPDKNETEANQLGDICPETLKFLKTEQGGRYIGP
jgi:hypothetical protein